MNGRVYDAELGRFLSADPNVQAPYATQNLNRYSYVMNNPLKYTDPSGFFFKKLFRGIKKFVRNVVKAVKKYARPILAIGAAVLFGPGGYWALSQTAWIAGAGAGFISGAIASGSLKGAVIGAVAGGLLSGPIHNMKAGFGKVLAHGAVGGATSKMQGGKFAHGFISGAFTQAVSSTKGVFKEAVNGVLKAKDRIYNAVVAAAIGGTASVLGGGKFANGAVTGAFSRLLNDDAGDAIVKKTMAERPNDPEHGYWEKVEGRTRVIEANGPLDIAVTPKPKKIPSFFESLVPNLNVGVQIYKEQQAYIFYEYVRDYLVDNNTGRIIGASGYGSRPVPSKIEWRDTGATRLYGSVTVCVSSECTKNLTTEVNDAIMGN